MMAYSTDTPLDATAGIRRGLGRLRRRRRQPEVPVSLASWAWLPETTVDLQKLTNRQQPP